MSSHHIIRDNQEPAILIEEITSFSIPLIKSLLEWSPIVITTYEKLETLLSLDIKIDVVFYKKKEENISFLLERQDGFYEAVKYDCDLYVEVLKWLNNKGHFALNYFTKVLSDHLISFWLKQRDIKTLVIFENKKRFILNKQSPYEKWLPQGVEIQLLGDFSKIMNLKRAVENYKVEENGSIKVCHNKALIIGEEMSFKHLY